ncbi:peptidase C14, caspase domain-containing protein [Boletus coccyginus]|nr:peptidase C14, caspase domain-containing protein [Boletus coccyginus]
MLRDFLITSHGYHPDDITLMMDDKNHPTHLWPTQDRILHQIDRLTSDAPEDCRFFFYLSGHFLNEDCLNRASMRTDSRDDVICADAKPILDGILHDRLVAPLQNVKGANLFALFDCCHSESLLDLERSTRPNKYSRVWKIGPGRLLIDFSTVVRNLFKLSKKYREKDSIVPPPPRRVSTKRRSPPFSKTEKVGELNVICLSACRDGQLAHDDYERELTFSQCFMDAMAANPTIKRLIADIRARYDETHLECSSSESDVVHETWTQEPRYCTGPPTDLTRKVSL